VADSSSPWAPALAHALDPNGVRLVCADRADEPDHLLLLAPSLHETLRIVRARLDRRGSTWLLARDSAEGAATCALVRASGVEGRQLVHAAHASAPTPQAVWAWLTSQPLPHQGPTAPPRRLEPIEHAPTSPSEAQVTGGRGLLAHALRGGQGPGVRVHDAPDRPLSALHASDLALPSPDEVVTHPGVVSADHVTQRPGSAPSAVVGAAAAWALARSDAPWAIVGPVGPGERVLGISGLDPQVVRRGLLGCQGEVWLDVHWEEALPAFPHMRGLAGHLVDHPVIRRGRAARAVCDEVSRLLGRRAVARDAPLADLGIDSLMAEELRQRLVTRFDVDLPLTLVVDHPTANAIAATLAAATRPRTGP